MSLKKKLFVPKIKFDNKFKLIKKLSSKNLFEELIKLNREYEFNHYKLKISNQILNLLKNKILKNHNK